MDLTRQGDHVPLWLRMKPTLIVGAGTTGSWTAHTLLRMGFDEVAIVDADLVEPHNAPAQFHMAKESGVGLAKVDGLSEAMAAVGLPRPHRTERGMFPGKALPTKDGLVFSCVDSMAARKLVAEEARKAGVHRLIDFRMGPENGSVLFVGPEGPVTWEEYMTTLDRPMALEPACGKRALLTTGLTLTAFGLGHWVAGEREKDLARRLDIDLRCARVVEVEP